MWAIVALVTTVPAFMADDALKAVEARHAIRHILNEGSGGGRKEELAYFEGQWHRLNRISLAHVACKARFSRASWRWPPQRNGRRRSRWSRRVIIELVIVAGSELTVHPLARRRRFGEGQGSWTGPVASRTMYRQKTTQSPTRSTLRKRSCLVTDHP